MCHEGSSPDKVFIVIIFVFRCNPAKQNSLSIQFKSTSCIISSAVKCIILWCNPWTIQALAHTINHFASVTVFCHNMIPPVTDFKQVWHFMHGIKVRCPEITFKLPVFQILGSKFNSSSCLSCFWTLQSCSKNQ